MLLHKDYSNIMPSILGYAKVLGYGGVVHDDNPSNTCRACRKKVWTLENKQEIPGINNIQTAQNKLRTLKDIFFHKEYGEITLFIFCYCLASLFRSKLTQGTSPLILQIACAKDTSVYELISEIITICDVNTGIYAKCRNENAPWSCNYNRHRCLYPLEIDRTIEHSLFFANTPFVVEGYGNNTRNYYNLLREVANRSNRREPHENVTLPIFMCSEIKAEYNNVFNMDLTSTKNQVSDDYLSLIKKERVYLTSLVFCFVRDFIERLFPSNNSEEKRQKYIVNDYPFSNDINRAVQPIQGRASQIEKNISILHYFFTGFMRSLKSVIAEEVLNSDISLTYSIREQKQGVMGHISAFIEQSMGSLIKVHKDNSSFSIDAIVPELENIADDNKSNAIKKARKYALDLVRIYGKFGTTLLINSIIVRGERYIFDASVPEGTRREGIYKDAEEVRAAMGVKYLKTDKGSVHNTIVISKDRIIHAPLKDILESSLFKESRAILPFAMGYDVMGGMVISDLAEFYHVFVGGSTRSGKTISLHSIILSIISNPKSINLARLIILDFGTAYFRRFNKVPHLLQPVTSDMGEGHKIIMWLMEELERRRELYQRDLDGNGEFSKLPIIFCIIDEFHKFIQHGDKAEQKELQATIKSILEAGAGLKIRLILAIQDPTEKNTNIGVTNVETILAFKCGRQSNSQVMLDGDSSASSLLGKGDMLFKSVTIEGIKNLQGAYMDEKEIAKWVDKLNLPEKVFTEYNAFTSSISDEDENQEKSSTSKRDDKFDIKLAGSIVLLFNEGKIATSRIQAKVGVGNPVAVRCMDKLIEYKLISEEKDGKTNPLLKNNISDVPSEVWELLARASNFSKLCNKPTESRDYTTEARAALDKRFDSLSVYKPDVEITSSSKE